MRALNALFVALIRFLALFIVRLEAGELEKLPKKGPYILAMNHVNFLDGPLLLARLFPRRVVSLAKRETWDNPLLGLAATAVGAVPVNRSGPDPAALRRVSKVLDEGGFLYINPEGTRSRDGVLGRGKAGVVAIARQTSTPVIPLAFEGLEDFGPSIRRLRRTRATLHVGEAFDVLPQTEGAGRAARDEAVAEIMRRIAALLPADKRGPWAEAETGFWLHTATRARGSEES